MEIGKGEVGETDPDRKASTKGPQRVRDRRKTVGFGEDTSTFILELEAYLHAHETRGIDVRRTWVHSDIHLEVGTWLTLFCSWFHSCVRGGDGVRARVSSYLLGKAATHQMPRCPSCWVTWAGLLMPCAQGLLILSPMVCLRGHRGLHVSPWG